MPIPNVSSLYYRIAKGSEGGHEFARIINLLLIAESKTQKYFLNISSDASGDYKGLDSVKYTNPEFHEFITGFQYKFYSYKLTSNQKAEIVSSLEKAISLNPHMQEWILITPEDFQKEQEYWFETIKEKYEIERGWYNKNGIARPSTLKLFHWGHSNIIELCLKHEHIGDKYFRELFPEEIGKFKLSKATINSKKSNWIKLPFSFNTFQPKYANEESIKITSDPVFDFHFNNSSNQIFLLHSIEIIIEETRSALNGIPAYEFLHSAGVLEHEIDFQIPVNTYNFPDPLIFKPLNPKRFELQLKNFLGRCPGNCAKLKFIFYFDNSAIIQTDSFSLIF